MERDSSNLGILVLFALGMTAVYSFLPRTDTSPIPTDIGLCIITVVLTLTAGRLLSERISMKETMFGSDLKKQRLCVAVCTLALVLTEGYLTLAVVLGLPMTAYIPMAVANSIVVSILSVLCLLVIAIVKKHGD